jgi:hypothetical protein
MEAKEGMGKVISNQSQNTSTAITRTVDLGTTSSAKANQWARMYRDKAKLFHLVARVKHVRSHDGSFSVVAG